MFILCVSDETATECVRPEESGNAACISDETATECERPDENGNTASEVSTEIVDLTASVSDTSGVKKKSKKRRRFNIVTDRYVDPNVQLYVPQTREPTGTSLYLLNIVMWFNYWRDR